MTKKEIVKAIAEKYDQSQVLVKDIVQETFNLIIETLAKDGRIELRNFGVFEVKLRKARRARNPKTDQEVMVGPKKVVTFQAGKVMEERARNAQTVSEPRAKSESVVEEEEDDLPNIPPPAVQDPVSELHPAIAEGVSQPSSGEYVPPTSDQSH